MLKKEYRLSSFLLNNPKQFSTPFFNVKFGKNGKSLNRFAFVVSKKVDNRATARNELKRKVRSCIEEIFDSISLGNDFIVYPKQNAKEASREQILGEVNKFFEKERLLK